MFALIILITENILLFGLLLIWLNRHCQKCQKVKCVERIFNQICQDCKDKKKKLTDNKFRSKKKNDL